MNSFKPSKIIKISDIEVICPTEFFINEQEKKFAIMYFIKEEVIREKLDKKMWNGTIEVDEYIQEEQNLKNEGGQIKYFEYEFSDLIDFELLESSESKLQGKGLMTTGGALLLGDVGALISMNLGDRQLKKDKSFIVVNIQINDVNTPLISLVFFKKEEQFEWSYDDCLERAREFVAILSFIKNNGKKETVLAINQIPDTDVLAQIEKLAELKEKQIICDEEFLESKTKLLNKLNT